MSLDPIKTTESIIEKYRSYLSTTFRLKNANLQKQFIDELQSEKFVKGPILESTPPYKTKGSLEKLISEGFLSHQFRKLESEELPLNRPLYEHQEIAIRKVVIDKKNIVVVTGTGSGKTEIFLLPIINYLFQQNEKNALTPGVRALLLYPLNALANDQLKRMRVLLKNYPDITFGRYTGETKKELKEAESEYIKRYGVAPLPNEYISREQMQNKPPHILLTNYAMLEYLLLRPKDHTFFDGEHAKYWKFLVIDEAHTYSGAKGIEMAMLLRRLKDRVIQSKPRRIQCIATSATLQGGEHYSKVAKFAQELFNEPFEVKDIITATHQLRKDIEIIWGKPEPSLYEEWQNIINKTLHSSRIEDLIKTGIKKGIPIKILEDSKKQSNNEYNRFLYHVLRGDKRLILLRDILEKKPQFLSEIIDKVFSKAETNTQRSLTALVDLGVQSKQSKNDQALLPIRYHLFVRAVEGAYLSILPEKKIYLERREIVKYGEKEYSVFEVATCRQCGAIYLVGETHKNEEKKFFNQPGKQYYEDVRALEYYLVLDEYTKTLPENEDELVDLEGDLKSNKYEICARCGAIDKKNLVNPLCTCGKENYFEVLRVNSKEGKVHKCPACTKTNPKGSIVWRFLLGKDAIASVLATSLYQQIPPQKIKTADRLEIKNIISDSWSQNINNETNYSGRKLLIFSDSRQDAAFFAPYLNNTYSQILRRRLILKVIDENKNKILKNKWRIQDLINPLKQEVIQLHLFPEKSLQEQEDEVYKWVFYEFLGIDNRIGLEGIGSLGFSLVKPKYWQPPKPLMDFPWKLSSEEIWILFKVLLDGFRKYGAISFPDNISPKDDFFQPINHECYFRENGSMVKRHILSWNPSSEKVTNSRSDFIMRLAERIGLVLSRSECIGILKNIWEKCLDIDNSSSYWKDYFSSVHLQGEGVVHHMKYNFWELQPGEIDKDIYWYHCDKCNKLTLFNIKGVCPTYRCDGNLKKCNPNEIFKDNHYRNLYLDLLPMRMKTSEHTA